MKLCEFNPFIRYAQIIHCNGHFKRVCVFDCRIFYVISGEISVCINGEVLDLKKNSLFYCCSGSVYLLSVTSDCSLAILNFDLSQHRCSHTEPYSPQAIFDFEDKSVKNAEIITDIESLKYLNGYFATDGLSYYPYICKIIDEYRYKAKLFREKSGAILKEMLINICRTINGEIIKNSFVVNIISYIHNHIDEPLSNKNIGEKFGYHPYYLSKLFLKYTGKTMHEYVIDVKIDTAMYYLRDTDKTINQIAEETGFITPSHFTNCFRKNLGISPSHYRQNNRFSV